MITGTWFFDEKYNCWCLEDVPYTERPTSPRYQQLSIFVPAPYMSAPGVVDEQGSFGPNTSRTVPVVFENNSAGYMQMPHTWLGGPRCYAEQYLERGFVYVTCGCRGRESRDAEGRLTGKSPAALVDLKTALRFLRHHRAQLLGGGLSERTLYGACPSSAPACTSGRFAPASAWRADAPPA